MNFTQKEKAVLQELMSGKRNSEIAESLNISVNTVRTHLSRMYAKTNTNGRMELVMRQIETEASLHHLKNTKN